MLKALFRGTPKPRKSSAGNVETVGGTMDYLRLPISCGYSLSSPTPRELRGIKRVLMGNYLYILLVFVPVGILSGVLRCNPAAVFVSNILAIIPLAMLLSFATDELSVNTGQTIGALLNATFGNAVEMIVSTVALLKGEVRIVQSSMLGAILSNVLLGLGCCLFIGGYSRDCYFNATAAQTMSSLMVVASTSLIVPTALSFAYVGQSPDDTLHSILILSRGTAVVLLILYALYLHFQLKSHSALFEEMPLPEGTDKPKKPDEPTAVVLSPLAAIATLFTVSITIAICAEYLVSAIDDVVSILNINKMFISLIILPIVGNAAEYISAAMAASRNKMDLALGVALGSSMQIALFVTPTLVLLGWIIQQPMSLSFEPFGAIVFFLSVMVVGGLVSDGESNYLEGAMLVGTYIIIAIAFYVYPNKIV